MIQLKGGITTFLNQISKLDFNFYNLDMEKSGIGVICWLLSDVLIAFDSKNTMSSGQCNIIVYMHTS